ncbi:MAG: hypothetical protein ACW99E_21500 [Promethearchaeota archaeon]|jgi:hypothetical protein
MKLKIIEVNPDSFAVGRNGVKSWIYWVLAETENGLEMEIFDLNGFDLRKYKNKYVDCLIMATAGDMEDVPQFTISGRFIQNYSLPSKWKGMGDLGFHASAVKTDYGVFLVESNDLRFKGKDGKIVEFNGFRLDLFYYIPIE